MKKFMFAFVLAISAMLAACGKKENYPVAASDAAGYPQQAQDHTIRDGLIGGALGYMLGRSSASNNAHSVYAPAGTTVNKTVINKTVIVQQPKPTPYQAPKNVPMSLPRPSVTPSYKPSPSFTPSFRPSPSRFSGGRR